MSTQQHWCRESGGTSRPVRVLAAGTAFTARHRGRGRRGPARRTLAAKRVPENRSLHATLVLPSSGMDPAVAGTQAPSPAASRKGTRSPAEVGIVTLVSPTSRTRNYLRRRRCLGRRHDKHRGFITESICGRTQYPGVWDACTRGECLPVGTFNDTVARSSRSRQALGGTTTQNYTAIPYFHEQTVR